jgi:hypothetical protein
MTHQKNKALTLLVSLIPGAGHMYMGFIKKGLSVMASINFIIMLVYIVNAPIFLLLCALLWFYAFFDVLNLNSMPAEVFRKQKDGIFIDSIMEDTPVFTRLDFAFGLKRKSTMAWLTILLGFFFLIRSVSDFVAPMMLTLTRAQITMIEGVTLLIPRLFLCALLVFVGLRLVANQKKVELTRKPDFDPEFTMDDLRSKSATDEAGESNAS